ncbi:MAG: DUF4382 domain-containing protein [Candidatus Bathyarchaeota archaeon]|nr:DUF4382 domain-containing protein [Candidatus Bathyarchaeota archaeon]
MIFAVVTNMSNWNRQAGLYGAVGILAAALIMAGFVIGGSILQGLAKASLTIALMDKPVALEHLNVTIDWAKIQDQNGNWYNLTLKRAPFYFDLLALQNVSETLSETETPAGNYTKIWMHVLAANATYPAGSNTDLNVPSDVIKVLLKPHLRLESGGQATVLIDLQPEDLNSIAISRSLNLRPVIKAVVP